MPRLFSLVRVHIEFGQVADSQGAASVVMGAVERGVDPKGLEVVVDGEVVVCD